MALHRDKKQQVINELADLLKSSKITVVANYKGLTVKNMQDLRRQAKESGTVIKVVKNRLVRKAISEVDTLKEVDTSSLKEMLVYAFNSSDEVAGPQVIKKFSKTVSSLEFVGAFTAEGVFIGAEDVTALADLPSKDMLRSQLVGTLAAPLTGFVGVVSGNVRGVLNVLQARSESIN